MFDKYNSKDFKILVIGDLILDKYLWGDTNRISPEAPVPIIDVINQTEVIGGAGNVAKNLISFNCHVSLLSVVGDCNISKKLKEKFENYKIDSSLLIEEKNRLTSQKTRIISSNQQILRYDLETSSPVSSLSQSLLIDKFRDVANQFNIVILSDYGKGVLSKEVCQYVINLCNKLKIKVIVDPKGKDFSKYDSAFLITPNLQEASVALGYTIDKTNLEASLRKLKEKYNLAHSIITLSEGGIALLIDNKLNIYPAYGKEIYDVTGAGDTVIASLAFCLANQLNIDGAVQFANQAASIVVGKIGSATATLDEIKNNFYPGEVSTIESKILSHHDLILKISEIKKTNKKIVFTNGCFDLYHIGHAKYLESAKSLGDILIVGINSDSSVKKLKGNERPINPLSDREKIIASHFAVDYVLSFDDETPLALIKKIQPDVLVKGGDYKNKTVVGETYSKQVVLIDYIKNKSTTGIIKKIQGFD